MASKIGMFDLKRFGENRSVIHHNPEAVQGLPVKAAEIIYTGCMVAYDPANSQAQSADPAMPATAIVVGFATETVDNRTGAKGDLTVKVESGIVRVKSDGNLTAAHLFKPTRIIDDHTVGVPAGTDADRRGPMLVALDGDYAWVALIPEVAVRGPITVTLTSTNGTAAAASANLANLAAETEKVGDDVRAIHAALVSLGLIAPAA